MRLFDERVFDWIRWNRDWFFSEGRFLMVEEEVRKSALKPLIEGIPEENRKQVFQLLAVLFPERSKLFEGASIERERHSSIVSRRGIGCEAGYDAYFTLYPSPNEVQTQVLNLFVKKLDDRAFLVELMKSYIDKKDRAGLTMVGRLFQELSFRFSGQDRPTPTQSLLDALFDVGEQVMETDWPESTFRASPRGSWFALLTQSLLAWGNTEAGNRLEQSFHSAKSTSLCASVFVHRARELGKISGGSGELPAITEEALESLGKVLLSKIKADVDNGALLHAPRLRDILRAWKYLGGACEAKAWLNKSMAESADLLSGITEGLVSYTIGTEPREYHMGALPDPELYDLGAILGTARKHLKGEALTADARNRVSVVAEAIKRHLLASKQPEIREEISEA